MSIPSSVAFLPDVHLTQGRMSRAWRVAKMFVKDTQPEMVILGGDFLEVESLSAWDMDKRRLMEGRRYEKEIAIGNREFDDLQNSLPSSRFVFMEGNHEARVIAYLDKHPEVEGMIDIRKNLNIDSRGAVWVKENDLYVVGHMHFLHGWYWNTYHSKRHVIDIGGNCMYGHVHKPQTHCHELRSQRRTHMAMSVGCLCDLNPIWMRNKPNSWQHGFGYVEFRQSGEFQATPINIIEGKLTFAGETWRAK